MRVHFLQFIWIVDCSRNSRITDLHRVFFVVYTLIVDSIGLEHTHDQVTLNSIGYASSLLALQMQRQFDENSENFVIFLMNL